MTIQLMNAGRHGDMDESVCASRSFTVNDVIRCINGTVKHESS
jgi:hypothetical protein